MTQWAYTPSFSYRVGTTLTIYCTIPPSHGHTLSSLSSPLSCTVGPYLLILWHSGPIPPHLLKQWVPTSASIVPRLSSFTSSLTCTVGSYLLILWHRGPIPPHWLTHWAPHSQSTMHRLSSLSFLLYLHSGPIPSHFMTQWAYTSSFTYTVDTTLAIYCTHNVQPQFLPYLHSGPIPPHFRTKWAYTPSFIYTVGTTLAIYYTQSVQSQILPFMIRWPHCVWTLCNVVIKCPLKCGSLLVSPPVFRQPTPPSLMLQYFYPTALKGCQGTVIHPWCLDGRAGKACRTCISETVRCRKLILGRDIG